MQLLGACSQGMNKPHTETRSGETFLVFARNQTAQAFLLLCKFTKIESFSCTHVQIIAIFRNLLQFSLLISDILCTFAHNIFSGIFPKMLGECR